MTQPELVYMLFGLTFGLVCAMLVAMWFATRAARSEPESELASLDTEKARQQSTNR